MTSQLKPFLLGAIVGLVAPALSAAAQAPAAPPTSPSPSAGVSAETQRRADVYYNLAMGRICEQMYESPSRSEYAGVAIDFYKKAYALDPHSTVIGERLAEMYWEAQRIQDALGEAQAVLKRNPNDLPSRRLLARIYLRSLGDFNSVPTQSESVARAIEQFREILRLDPSDSESALWLARLYRMQNQHEKAGVVLRDLIKQDPDNEPALEQLTQLLLDQGKPKEAVALLEDATKDSSSPSLFDFLGDAYSQTKDYARAAGAYREAIELDPSEGSHHRGLAEALMNEEKYTEALAEYKRLAELDPDDPKVYLRLAQVYRELHQLDQAEENLAKARQRAPGDIEIIYNEAVLYQAQGRFEDAIRVLSNAVAEIKAQTNPLPANRRGLGILDQQLGQLYREVQNYSAAINTFEEMYTLGDEEGRRGRLLVMDTYRAAKDLPHALEVADKALVKYPKDQAFLSGKALLLGMKGDTDAAVGILRGMLTGTATDRDIYLNLAEVYQRGGRFTEAEAAVRTAEKLAGQPRDNEVAWSLLGAIYERQKKYDRAEQEFKRVLAVSPRDAQVLNNYGYMLGDLGIRLDEARSLVERALAEEPYNGAYLDSLGWVNYKQGRFDEAESLLRRAVERDKSDPTIHAHLGDVYFKMGRTELAGQEWERSLAEWRRALPTEIESEKIAEIQAKLSTLKRDFAQQKPGAGVAKPQ